MDPDFSRQKISILQNLEKFENFWIFFKWCSRHMLTRLDIFVLGLTRLGTLELSDSRLINSTIFKIFWWCLSFAAFIFINSLFKKNIISSTFLNHIIRKHGFYIKPLSTSNRENEDLVERPSKTVRRRLSIKGCPRSPIGFFIGSVFPTRHDANRLVQLDWLTNSATEMARGKHLKWYQRVVLNESDF